jgi:hypothetical protein
VGPELSSGGSLFAMLFSVTWGTFLDVLPVATTM